MSVLVSSSDRLSSAEETDKDDDDGDDDATECDAISRINNALFHPRIHFECPEAIHGRCVRVPVLETVLCTSTTCPEKNPEHFLKLSLFGTTAQVRVPEGYWTEGALAVSLQPRPLRSYGVLMSNIK